MKDVSEKVMNKLFQGGAKKKTNNEINTKKLKNTLSRFLSKSTTESLFLPAPKLLERGVHFLRQAQGTRARIPSLQARMRRALEENSGSKAGLVLQARVGLGLGLDSAATLSRGVAWEWCRVP